MTKTPSLGMVAIISFRLDGPDGVSVEAKKWADAFSGLGFNVVTVAGEGAPDRLVTGLGIASARPPAEAELARALADVDLAVVENLCSLPLNPYASAAVAGALRRRRAILHHHDLPWQRPAFVRAKPPPTNPAWLHVTVNEISREQLAAHGIKAVTMYNRFEVEPGPGNRAATRQALGVSEKQLVVLQPTRAIGRKNVPGGLALAEALGGLFWLLGPAEDGYGPELERILSRASTDVRRGPAPGGWGSAISDAYAASDVVVLPSTWEGFGNPSVESATHRRPLAIGRYPVACELAGFGFRWFAHDEPAQLARWFENPDMSLLDHNQAVAREHFDLSDLGHRLEALMSQAGWRFRSRLGS